MLEQRTRPDGKQQLSTCFHRLPPRRSVSQRLSIWGGLVGWLYTRQQGGGAPVKLYHEPCPRQASTRQACRCGIVVSVLFSPSQR